MNGLTETENRLAELLPVDRVLIAPGDADEDAQVLSDVGRICAVRLSRRIPEADYSAITARLMKAVDRGYILAGTFISPCERVVAKALDARGAPMIRAVPDALAMVYRPKCDEPRQFAEGRLLLLSRVAAPGSSRSEAWHGINSALADFACSEPGGLSVYARSARDFCVLRPGCASA